VVGFEYWSDPNDRSAGSVTWQVDGQRSHRVLATAVAPDQGTDGSGVGQRLVPEEPMSIVLNLGISRMSFFYLFRFVSFLRCLYFVSSLPVITRRDLNICLFFPFEQRTGKRSTCQP